MRLPKNKGPIPSVTDLMPLIAPRASPTASGSTEPLTSDERLGYTRFPSMEKKAQTKRCQLS